MTSPLIFSPFVRSINEFQQLALINKAAIDLTAVDIPVITLAKNQTERKERIFQQVLVFLFAFVIAPLHAKGAARICSRQLGFKTKGLSEKLMQLSYKDLTGLKQLQIGIKTLFSHQLKETVPNILKHNINEALRKKLIKAKTIFLITDLTLEAFLFSNIGFLKALFGKHLSGKEQFSGEFGIVSNKTLDAIYKEDSKTNLQYMSPQTKRIISLSIGIALPLLLGGAIFKAMSVKNATGWLKFIRNNISPLYDYKYALHTRFLKGWPLLSDAMLVVAAITATTGALCAARSSREFKEVAIQNLAGSALFFLGTPAFMKILSGSTNVQEAINKVKSKNPAIIKQIAKKSAILYLLSFILGSLGVSAIMVLTNNITRKSVKERAEKFDINQQSALNKHPHLPMQVTTGRSVNGGISLYNPGYQYMRYPVSGKVPDNYHLPPQAQSSH